MIEKGKGPVLGKIRTIKLIEANIQLIMRFFVNIRNKGRIELDERVSKIYYRSRTGNSIEDVILEKILVFDNSIVIISHTIYSMTDLQACYDRQLSKIGAIGQESVGLETKPIKLMTKILPIMEYYVRTSFGVSTEFYRGSRLTLARTGHGNMVSVNICRDSSCIMLKDVDKEKWGVA